MRRRCEDPEHPDFARFEETGITIAKEWTGPEGFRAFMMDVGSRPGKRSTLKRQDQSGDFGPGNVGWVNLKNPQRNLSTNRMIAYQGQTRCLAEWAEIKRIHRKTLQMRLDRMWSVRDAMETPAGVKRPKR